MRFDEEEEEDDDDEDDDGAALVRAGRESNPEKNPTAGYYLYGWSSVRVERSGRLDGNDAGDGDSNGGAAGDGDGGEAAPCRGCSRSRLASSRI